MPIDVTKPLEERFNEKLRCGNYRSADELLERALSSLEGEESFRSALAEGISQADRGELIPGEEVLAELDALLDEMERAEKAG